MNSNHNFNPKDFIKISVELENGNTEAHYRSVINRSYYGAFGYIKKKLGSANFSFSVHQEIINTLLNSVSINQKKAGKRLETLFKNRKDADYNHFKEIKKFNCDYCVREAEEIIRLFDLK